MLASGASHMYSRHVRSSFAEPWPATEARTTHTQQVQGHACKRPSKRLSVRALAMPSDRVNVDLPRLRATRTNTIMHTESPTPHDTTARRRRSMQTTEKGTRGANTTHHTLPTLDHHNHGMLINVPGTTKDYSIREFTATVDVFVTHRRAGRSSVVRVQDMLPTLVGAGPSVNSRPFFHSVWRDSRTLTAARALQTGLAPTPPSARGLRPSSCRSPINSPFC